MRSLFKILAAFLFCVQIAGAEPAAVYLTWQQKPDTTMTICWITPKEANATPGVLRFHQRHTGTWYEVSVKPKPLPEQFPYQIYTVELMGLTPDTRYEFSLPETSRLYHFYTLPGTLSRPVRFVSGGDAYHDALELVSEMNRTAAKLDPDFVVLGGDIAYASPRFSFMKEDAERWLDFITTWSNTMQRSDGSLIPLLTAIGNHDVSGRYDETPMDARFYYMLFPTPNNSYHVIDIGGYMSLWLLDTGHAHAVAGAQTAWLEKTLGERRNVPNKYAFYHVPAYPSVRSSRAEHSAILRKNWTPLFDKYHLSTAFEHHEHAYKRTHPLINGKADPNGVLYMGDGAWGIEKPRTPKTPKKAPYIAASAGTRHILLVTTDAKGQKYEAFTADGELIDSYTRSK